MYIKYPFIFFLLLSLTTSAVAQSLALQKSADGHFQLPATINDITATFILDTGATGSVIDINQLAKFGIAKPADSFAGVQAGGTESGQIDVWPIQINGFVIAGKSVNINDIYANDMHGQFENNIAGIIGQDAITDLAALIDISAAQLIIPNEHNGVKTAVDLSAYQSIVLQRSDLGFSFVDAMLDSTPVRFLIDSGASETVFDISVLRQLGYTPTAHPTAKTMLSSGVEEPMSVINNANLVFADINLNDDFFVTDFAALMQAINHQQQRLFIGVLGNKQMRKLHAIIDLANSKIYVRR